MTKRAKEREDKAIAEGKPFKRYLGIVMDGRMKKSIKQIDGILSMLNMYGLYRSKNREYFFVVDPDDGAILSVYRGNKGYFPEVYDDDRIEKEFGDMFFTISDKIRNELAEHDVINSEGK